MSRPGTTGRIAALLEEVDDLLDLGRTAQGAEESSATTAVRALQDRYPVWYSQALAALPDDLRHRFTGQYESQRPLLAPKIDRFLAEPRRPWAAYDSVPRFLRSHGRWQYALRPSFEEPLREQRRVLLEAQGRIGTDPDVERTTGRLVEIFRRLPAALNILGREHRQRQGLPVDDEYDLQRVVHALLRLHFDDVEPEETTPRRAGGSYRMDFLLRRERVVVEVKMTRPSLGARELRHQLVDDLFGYRRQPGVAALLFVVLDRDRHVDNPAGFEQDIADDDPELLVRAVIAQG
ncbi:hypothetical protein ABZ805_00060 [Saccharopolyspora sp. NPDC047091]|uniref:PD-(D/E)XK nuclease domain-containing protein n=1 Tax=Saccharopolyspora sp. NPDC047091 TaxID=3155924 RepID=UPI0033DB2369